MSKVDYTHFIPIKISQFKLRKSTKQNQYQKFTSHILFQQENVHSN